MKKVTLLLAGLIMTTGLFAQGFSYGVKTGVNISTLSNTKDLGGQLNRKMKTGVYAGAFVEYQFTDFVALQGELVYSRQGNTYFKKFSDQDLRVRQSMKMDYLNIPILVKLSPIDRLSIDLGPQFGFCVGAREFSKIVDKSGDRAVDISRNKMPSAAYKTFDFSIAMGVTYELTDMFEVSARYNLGLTDVMKGNPGDKISNRVIQIGGAFKF